jgi:hypothetical protein
MRKRHGRWKRLFLTGLVLATGCNREDADRLARASRRGLANVEAVLSTAASGLPGWKGAPGLRNGGLVSRVAARLQWDKGLTDVPIEVQAQGGVVELRGKVHDLNQRRRAIELAETTAGVEKVNDQLQTEGP